MEREWIMHDLERESHVGVEEPGAKLALSEQLKINVSGGA